MKRCHIYIALKLDDFELIEDIIRYINTSINISADYLEKALPRWLANQSSEDGGAAMIQRDIFRQLFLKQKEEKQEFMNKNRKLMKKLKEGKMVEAFEAIGPQERKNIFKANLFKDIE